MVIILQQTLEDGHRFVSTVVEGTAGSASAEEASFTSNFSINSQHSISERSAVYKQRIDSLFGRPSRLSPFHLNPDGCNVRINGKSITPLGACKLREGGRRNNSCGTSNSGTHSDDDDDDSYSRITEKGSSSSVVTDSLNHRAIIRDGWSHQFPNSNANVSSVRITCGSETADTPQQSHQSIVFTSFPPSSGHEGSGSSSHGLDSVTVNHPPRNSTNILIPSHSPLSSSKDSSGSNNMWRNGTYGECPANTEEQSSSFGGCVRNSPGGMLQFSVEYLGSVPVDGTTTSLQDLQSPLKDLYMDFLTRKNVMSGQLAITSDGIRFEAPKLRLVNPFSTIAVWAAIKFVARGEPMPMECAFMPLISDPEGQDKSRLFGPMDPNFAKTYLTCMTGSKNGGFKNPPLFACVMREASFSLDCHAFACKCAEDAIVVAANLYQSLVDKMRSGNKEGESGYGSLNRTSPGIQSSPNQNRSSSSASSSAGVLNEGPCSNGNGGGRGCGGARRRPLESGPSSSSGLDDKHGHRVVFSDSESIAPIRPPRRKKKSSEIPSGNLKRYNSEDSVLLKMPNRRKSIKRNYYYQQNGKVKKRVQISTPEETSSADSIHESIDQVLDRIINPGGMSFNDLKPSYQDLILKIALTLTQDQLYQKSKQAMKKQQIYLRKKSKHLSSGEASDDNSQFLNHLLKSFSKMKSNKSSSSCTNKRSAKCGALKHNNNNNNNNNNNHPVPAPRKVILKKPKEEEPLMSFCSGCVCESCSDKCYCSLPSKQNLKLSSNKAATNDSTTATTTTTTTKASTSITCPMVSACTEKNKPRKLCGYDSESCAESEKCYCSLQRVKSNGLKIYNINLDTETSDTDTNSYDLEPFNQQQETSSSSNGKTVSARSVEILSYHPSKRLAYSLSPGNNIQTTSAIVHFEDSLNIQSSSNKQTSPNNNGGKALSPYCSGQKISNMSKHQRDKVLLITGSSPSARVMYKEQDGKKSRNGMHRNLLDIMEDDDCNDDEDDLDGREENGQAEKVLSMKKTAEIAAMFTDLKLDQTTNVIPDLASGNFDSIQNTEDSTASLDFEASLGYLP